MGDGVIEETLKPPRTDGLTHFDRFYAQSGAVLTLPGLNKAEGGLGIRQALAEVCIFTYT